MKAATRQAGEAGRADLAGAETLGALILFGLFVTVIALLNVTAVPDAGLAAEEAHHARVLDALGGLQAEAEAAANPASLGATLSRSVPLGPERDAGQDFFSFFLAEPSRSAGQLSFTHDYGNVTLSHTRQGVPGTVYDVGSPHARFPLGRLTFDPHPHFRPEGVLQWEGGALVATSPEGATLRHAPPVSVAVQGDTTHVSVKVRVLNGTAAELGGTSSVRVGLATEAATLVSPRADNADQVTLRLETAHGEAWGAWLNATSATAGLAAGEYSTLVQRGAAPGGLDVVTWTVLGTGTGNDVRLTSGLAVQGVRLG